ncbi:MAG: DUF1269 domain-containing protein [Prochloraceae cyanobacterium]
MAGKKTASNLVVIGFDDELQADEVRNALEAMEKEHLVDLEDAVVVVKNSEGELMVKQEGDFVAADALKGGLLGLLIGAVLLELPFLGLAAAAGALGGSLLHKDLGIEDEFIEKLGQTLAPETSALFILVQKAEPDKVLEELKQFKGKILQTSLSQEDEAKLKAVLEKTSEQ